uniref:ATP synthase complex subunit 8 n=1 Tax=Aleochara sp. 2 EF-2015 TaxID=1756844 RepID=A0A0S2M6J0_9COLE|nr:ATP synthase F0 subunit 8 [Aleochara sp. 2 EF-2015]
MPQMAPMNWLTLFFLFIVIFMIFNSMNYFSFMYNTKMTTNIKKNKILTSWKW